MLSEGKNSNMQNARANSTITNYSNMDLSE